MTRYDSGLFWNGFKILFFAGAEFKDVVVTC